MTELIPNRRVLRYLPYNTVEEGKETDSKFLEDLLALSKQESSLLKAGSMMIKKETHQQLTAHQCEQIAVNAELHRDACRPNSTDIAVPIFTTDWSASKIQRRTPRNKCPCGCGNVAGQDLPFCVVQAKLGFMGSSLVLFFFFMRIVVATAFVFVAVFGLFALVTNMIGGEADTSTCNEELLCVFKRNSTIEGKRSNMYFSEVQAWLGVSACFLCILISRYAKVAGTTIYETIDRTMETPSDLAIKLQNLPFAETDEDQLIEVIKNKERKLTLAVNENRQEIRIKAIHLVYSMKKVRALIESISEQSKHLAELLQKDLGGAIKPQCEAEYQSGKLRLIELVEELQDFQKRFLTEVLFRRSLSTTCCIIEFCNQVSRDKFLRRYGTKSMGVVEQLKIMMKRCLTNEETSKIELKGNLIKVELAPQPQDISWENCEERYSLMRLVVIWLVTFLIILLSLGVVVGLEYAQINISRDPRWQENGAALSTIFNYIVSISLMVVNKLLWVVLFYLIKIEFSHTTSEEVISRINKTIIAQSLNCIVVPIITNIAMQSRLYGTEGLTGQVLDYSISNAIIPLVLLFVEPGHLIKVLLLKIQCARIRIIRYMWKQEVQTEGERNFEYVTRVNQFYEGSDFDVTSSYVYLLANLLHASFYCSIQPFLLVMTGLGGFCFYYLKKYLLLTRYTQPKMLSKLVFSNAITALNYIPIFYGTGGLVFFTYIYEPQVSLIVPSGIAVLLGLLNIFNPGGVWDQPVGYFYRLANRKTVTKRNIAPQIVQLKDSKRKKSTWVADKKSDHNSPRKHLSRNTLQENPERQLSERQKHKSREEQLEDNFRHNVEYYYHNHISTLLGASRLLVDMPINNKVRRVVSEFVRGFGNSDNTLEYPKEAGSSVELRSDDKEAALSDFH